MANENQSSGILLSVLDRLIDEYPEMERKPFRTPHQSLQQTIRAVTRDLEGLLNTRQERLGKVPPEFTQARQSLAVYGIPDFSTLSFQDTQDRNHIRRVLEQAIGLFEPRLERVRVTLEPSGDHDHTLRFRIDAMLQVDPAPEPVTFDATLYSTQEYIVQAGS